MQEQEVILPEKNEASGQSSAPLTPPQFPARPSLSVIKSSHDMLVGFREAVREGTYQGKHLIRVAEGLMFLESLVNQSIGQLEEAKAEEKEMIRKLKEDLKIKGENNGSENKAG